MSETEPNDTQLPELGLDDEMRFAFPVGGDLDHLEWLAPEVIEGERRLKVSDKLLTKTNEFIASTDKEAADGDIIDQRTWRLGHYKRNPVVLDTHLEAHVVGTSVAVGVVDNALRTAILWDDDPVNVRGQLVAHQHRNRIRRAVSVRWTTGKRTRRDKLPKDHPFYRTAVTVQGYFGAFKRSGNLLEHNTLREISSVSIPSDPRALQVRGVMPARQFLDQVPDEAVATALEDRIRAALDDEELFQTDRFVTEMRSLVLRFVRSDTELQTAMRALGLASPPPNPPEEPEGLSAWFGQAFKKKE